MAECGLAVVGGREGGGEGSISDWEEVATGSDGLVVPMVTERPSIRVANDEEAELQVREEAESKGCGSANLPLPSR